MLGVIDEDGVMVRLCHGLDKLWKWKYMFVGVNMYE
jgi:hypothetical protein